MNRWIVSYFASQDGKSGNLCAAVIASDQRERGNLAAIGIASVTSFFRNDTLFSAFILELRFPTGDS